MEDIFVGIQVGPQAVYDEGIDNALDLMQQTAGINTLIVYTHTYYGASDRPAENLAPDHGIQVRDERKRNLPGVWIKHNEKRFGGTFLRHKRNPNVEEYADRDILEDLYEPAKKRGMKLYARILEPHQRRTMRFIDNWSKVLAVDVYGRIHESTCFNNPAYKNFWISTIEDELKTYPFIDGMQYGSERCGPLSRLLFWDDVPACFCDYCAQRARNHGIDPERARKGYRVLYEFVKGLKEGTVSPVDGAFVTFVRILMKYPEILAWDQQAHESKEDLAKLLYGTAKVIRPDMPFGIHVDHQESTWDIFQVAEIDYADMTNYCDFVKPIVYHDIAAPRVRRWYLEKMHNSILKEVPLETLLDAFYSIMGYNKDTEPKLEEMDNKGFSEEYVYRLTKRIVDGVGGKVPVYPGIGFDVPWKNKHLPADENTVYKCVHRALDAGASGICVSREYSEMRVKNLKAVGRALRDRGYKV